MVRHHGGGRGRAADTSLGHWVDRVPRGRGVDRGGGTCGEQLKRCTLELGGEVGGDRARRRRSGGRRAGARAERHLEHRPGMRRADAHPPAAGAIRRVGRTRSVTSCGTMPTGDPIDPATRSARSSPIASAHASRATSRRAATKARASSWAAAARAALRGWYVEPTLFADVHNDMKIAREEIFGPVLVAHPLRRSGRRGAISPTTPTTGCRAPCGQLTIERGIEVATRSAPAPTT